MASLRISSPSSAAALLLVDLLSDHGAAATQDPSGDWQITVPLDGAARGVVPQTLAVAREWRAECGLHSVPIMIDGHTHLLHGDRTLTATLH